MKRSPYDIDPRAASAVEAAVADGPRKLFDVTVTAVVATIYDDDGNGPLTPRQAAFVAIADYSNNIPHAEFGFPNGDGSLETVTVHTSPFPSR